MDEVLNDEEEHDAVPLPPGLLEVTVEGNLKRELLSYQLFPNDI